MALRCCNFGGTFEYTSKLGRILGALCPVEFLTFASRGQLVCLSGFAVIVGFALGGCPLGGCPLGDLVVVADGTVQVG